MEIGQHLVLSTAHIHYATAELLNTWAKLPPVEQPLAIASTQYGWFVSTNEEVASRIANAPKELRTLLAFGRAQECAYILLDCDGPEQDELPRFPW